jgi:GntR family transcriptional repressor for pyruvate dehydrogenase complex
MSSVEKPQAIPVSDGLFNDILAGILMGDYPPQSKLPSEQRLAHVYGVSRAVVRMALERLKDEHIVESRQGSGTIVANVELEVIGRLNRDAQLSSLKDCYDCRLAIEPKIAAAVAKYPSPEVDAFLQEQRIALETDDQGDEYERSARDAHFHIQLAMFSRNVFFISIMNTMRPHLIFAMNVSKTLAQRAQQQHLNLSRQEHLHIISTILERNPEAAECAMRDHIEMGVERIFAGSKGRKQLEMHAKDHFSPQV